MSDTIIGAIISAVAVIVAAIIGLFCAQKKTKIKFKQIAKGSDILQVGIKIEKKEGEIEDDR